MQDKDLPVRRSLHATIIRWRARAIWKYWLKTLYSPILSASSFFSFLTVPFTLFFILAFAGEKAASDRSTLFAAGALATIFALPVWAAVVALAAPFRVLGEEHKIGGWKDNKFIYLERKLLVTTEVEAGDNQVNFDVKDIPAGAVVDYRIDIEGPASRLNCVIFGAYYVRPIEEIMEWTRFALEGKAVVRKNKTLSLLCRSAAQTVPAIVRVYALSWAIDPNISMEYTDQKIGVRLVIAPPDAPSPS
jgi:hypothetical protein